MDKCETGLCDLVPKQPTPLQGKCGLVRYRCSLEGLQVNNSLSPATVMSKYYSDSFSWLSIEGTATKL